MEVCESVDMATTEGQPTEPSADPAQARQDCDNTSSSDNESSTEDAVILRQKRICGNLKYFIDIDPCRNSGSNAGYFCVVCRCVFNYSRNILPATKIRGTLTHACQFCALCGSELFSTAVDTWPKMVKLPDHALTAKMIRLRNSKELKYKIRLFRTDLLPFPQIEGTSSCEVPDRRGDSTEGYGGLMSLTPTRNAPASAGAAAMGVRQCAGAGRKRPAPAPPRGQSIPWRQQQRSLFCDVCGHRGTGVHCSTCPASFHPQCLSLPPEYRPPTHSWRCHACMHVVADS